MGEYGEKELSLENRQALLPRLRAMYRTTTDPGLHAAAEWLLRTWNQEAWLRQVNQQWAKEKEQREKRLDGLEQTLAKEKEKSPPQWYVNGQGQTMVVIPGSVEFVMGSPPTEAGRRDDEFQHKKRIDRTFALASTPVTVEQFRRFEKGSAPAAVYTHTGEFPVVGISWYMAAKYCNWLSKEEGIPEHQWCYDDLGRRDQLEVGLPEPDGLSAAHGIRDGVCDPCEGGNERVLRRDGRVAAEVCVVQQELPRKVVAGGKPEAERPGFIRRSRECVHMVSGEFQTVSFGARR